MIVADINHTSSGQLRIVFRLIQSQSFVIELGICFTNAGAEVKKYQAAVGKIIDNSRYGIPLCADCVECEWHQLVALVNRCKDEARSLFGKATTRLWIQGREKDFSSEKGEFLGAIAATDSLSRTALAT